MVVGTAGSPVGVTLIAVACPGIAGGAEGVTLMARGGGGPVGVTLIARATGTGGGGRVCASVTVAEGGPSPWYIISTPPRWMVWPACKAASLTGARLRKVPLVEP